MLKKKRNKFPEPRELWSERLWNEKYDLLQEYLKIFGHFIIPKKISKEFLRFEPLRHWNSHQRTKYKKNTLMYYRYELLTKIGFCFDPLALKWEEGYAKVIEYYKQYGTITLKIDYKYYTFISHWLSYQRVHKDLLSKKQIERLDLIGFEWNNFDERWYNFLEQLKEFKKLNGHCNVKSIEKSNPKYNDENKRLVHWVQHQRQKYKNGELTENQINELKNIDFSFNTLMTRWEMRFNELKEYKNKFGTCDVPLNSKEYKTLGVWVNKQKNKKNKLTTFRLEKLNSIGFIWNILIENWALNYNKLKMFKEENGHCRVLDKHDKSLSLMVKTIRIINNGNSKGRLTAEQKQKLDDLGFIWNVLEYSWENNFKKLEKFKSIYGHVNIFAGKTKYLPLYGWLRQQKLHKDRLNPVQIKKLEEIGVVF
jgi:hypothetical protein